MLEPTGKLQRNSGWATVAFLLLGIPVLYWAGVLDITSVNQLGRYLAFAVAAIGLDLIWGYAGVLSLCQAMFFCFGAYCMGMHMAMHGPQLGDDKNIPYCLFIVTSEVKGFLLPWFWRPFASLPITLILGVLLPGLFASIFGFFAFRSRVRGVYFSIITQALTLAVCMVVRRNETRLGGTNGLNKFEHLAGFDLSKPGVILGLYVLTVLVLIAVYLCCKHIVNSRFGRLLVAVRDNESRLRFAGYQPVTIKLFAFAASAVIAAIAGMLYAPQFSIIAPSDMEPGKSLLMVVWVAVGGRGTLSGAALGALLVNGAYSFLTTHWPASWPFVQGAMYMGVVLFFPDGCVGAWRKLIGGRAADPAPAGRDTDVLPADAPTHVPTPEGAALP